MTPKRLRARSAGWFAVAVEVKICGLTRPADAALAARLGAAYLGVVFAESTRQVGPAVARDIVNAGGGVPVVGVFVSHPVEDILRLRESAGLSAVQLHGAYDAAVRMRLARERLPFWVVQHIAGPDDLDRLPEQADGASVLMVEPRVPGAVGGTGVALDLSLAQAARARMGRMRLALAGGLRPDTLARAVALVSPDIVDVSSGVESAPGLKDADRLARFLEVARDA
jgi:phosphoribosylanthranilate isomerase